MAGWLVLPVVVLFAGRAVLVAITAPRHVARQERRTPTGWSLPAVSHRGPGVQRGGRHRRLRPSRGQPLPLFRYRRCRRRLRRPYRRHRRGFGLGQCVASPPGEYRKGASSQCRDRGLLWRGRGDRGRRHRAFETDTLLRLVEAFADGRVGAVAGNTKVGNRRGVLGRWQHLGVRRRLRRWTGGFTTCWAACPRSRVPPVPFAARLWRRWAGSATRRWPRTPISRWPSAGPGGPSPLATRPVPGQRHQRTCDPCGGSETLGSAAPIVACGNIGGRFGKVARWAGGACHSWSAYQVALPLIAPAIDVYAFSGLLDGQHRRLFAGHGNGHPIGPRRLYVAPRR